MYADRTAGTGLVGFGLLLVAVGAILKYAVTVTTNGFNVNRAGAILLIIGIVLFVLGVFVLAIGGRSRTTIRRDVHNTPDGRQQIEQHDQYG